MRTRKPRRTSRPRVARQFGQRGTLRRRRPGALSGDGQKIQKLQEQMEAGEITPEEFESYLEQLESKQHTGATRILIARARRQAAVRTAIIEPADVLLLQNGIKQLSRQKSADEATLLLDDIIQAAQELKNELEA